MKSDETQNAYKSVILSLSEHLCVSRVINIEEKVALLIAPFSTGGRMRQAMEPINDVKDIRVLHHMMYLWFENNNWIVEYELGQTRPRDKFKDKSEAINFMKVRIEEYWGKVFVHGG